MKWGLLAFVILAWVTAIGSLVATFMVRPGSAGSSAPAPKRTRGPWPFGRDSTNRLRFGHRT